MKKIVKICISVFIAAFMMPVSTLASNQIPGAPQTEPIALTGGTIHTISKGDIENGTLLFEKGKIKNIGQSVNLPANTKVINISGKHVYPGLISAYSGLGLTEISAVRATNDFSEVGAIKPNVRAEVAFNPDSENIPVTRSNGILLALSVPSGGLISGTSALMMLDGWSWENMILKAPSGLDIYWPSMNIDRRPEAAKSTEEQKKAIDDEIKKINDAFDEARDYIVAKDAEKEKGVPYHKIDVKWESMRKVLEGKIPVFIHAEEISQIHAAIDWTEKQKVKMVLVGGYDSWRASKILAEKKIPVIVVGINRLPVRDWEPFDLPYIIPLKLFNAGVKFCISGDGGPYDAPQERNLPYQAAKAAAYGLPKAEALKAVTLNAAEILGVDDQVGSLEEGKDATLIITTGDPLEISTNVEMAFIQGRTVDLNSKQTLLYKKYQEKYRQLNQQQKY